MHDIYMIRLHEKDRPGGHIVVSAVEPGLAAATDDVEGEVFPPAGREVNRGGSRGREQVLG